MTMPARPPGGLPTWARQSWLSCRENGWRCVSDVQCCTGFCAEAEFVPTDPNDPHGEGVFKRECSSGPDGRNGNTKIINTNANTNTNTGASVTVNSRAPKVCAIGYLCLFVDK